MADELIPPIQSVPNLSPAGSRQAFEAVRAEIEAITDDQLVGMNLDVPSVTVAILGRTDELKQYRDQLAALPDFNIAKFDKLETYARAAWHAQTE